MSPHALRRGTGAGPLLIHCSLAHSGAWTSLLRHLGPDGAVAMDLPGHGRSPDWDGALDYHKVAVDWAVSLIERPTHVVGHSFGGTVALRVAASRPDLVTGLTLIEPVYFAALKARDAEAFERNAEDFAPIYQAFRDGDRDTAARLFNDTWTDDQWVTMPERHREYARDRIGLVMAQGPGISDDTGRLFEPGGLDAVRCPVTLVRGGQSPCVIECIHGALLDYLPQAQEHVIEDATHMLPVTHAEQLAALILGPAG